MPSYSDMHPSPYMNFRDFDRGVLHIGTIHSVVEDPFAPRRSPAPTPEWVVFFHEYEKPLRLPPGRHAAIGKVLGTETTEEWVGRAVGFYRGVIPIAGNRPGEEEIAEGIFIDNRAPAAPKAPAKPATLLDTTKANTVIPRPHVDRFLDRLRALVPPRFWDDFLGQVKDVDRPVHDAIVGHDLDSIPGSVAAAMADYLHQHDPQPPADEAPDFTTPGVHPPIPLDEKDIPF